MADVIVSVVVIGVPATLAAGQTANAVARITTDVGDNAVDPQSIVWSSSNTAVATVAATATGCAVRGVAAGSATIRAAVGAVAGSSAVTVTVPFVDITAAQEAAIRAFPVGSQFVLKGPTGSFTVAVSA